MEKVHNTLVNTERVDNILVQYGLLSTIYPFNMERGPQYISSIWKRVHNTLVKYRKWSIIH